jgi:hypothetical protein
MSQTLDKNRPFGTVVGDPDRGFHQDGAYFDHSGKRIGGQKSAAPAQQSEKSSVESDADSDGKSNNDVDLEELATPAFDEMERDDLKAWLQGQGVEFRGNAATKDLLKLAKDTFAKLSKGG